jgi:ferrous iron transport protein A
LFLFAVSEFSLKAEQSCCDKNALTYRLYAGKGEKMLPLTLAKTGNKILVARISGNQDIKKHLEDLGFVVGTQAEVVSAAGDGNVIVNLKGSRLAITKEMSSKIMVDLN